MARIPQAIIDRINATADIVDVVSKTVELKKRGRNFFGLCPFHDEKTPSFSVAPDKGIYHCFGCGKGGNAVNFIIENEKLSFVEAIQQLGQQLGIPVEFSGGGESKISLTACIASTSWLLVFITIRSCQTEAQKHWTILRPEESV